MFEEMELNNNNYDAINNQTRKRFRGTDFLSDSDESNMKRFKSVEVKLSDSLEDFSDMETVVDAANENMDSLCSLEVRNNGTESTTGNYGLINSLNTVEAKGNIDLASNRYRRHINNFKNYYTEVIQPISYVRQMQLINPVHKLENIVVNNHNIIGYHPLHLRAMNSNSPNNVARPMLADEDELVNSVFNLEDVHRENAFLFDISNCQHVEEMNNNDII